MHNYDTGISLVKKKDNWGLIEKFLKVLHIFTNVREWSSLVDHLRVCQPLQNASLGLAQGIYRFRLLGVQFEYVSRHV